MTNSKYPTPVVPNVSYNNSVKPVPQKRGPEIATPNSLSSSSKSRLNTSGQNQSKSEKQRSQNKPKLPELKPTFSTFKQFNRTASLSDLINEDDTSIVVKPEVIQKRTNHKSIKNSPNSKKSSNTNKNNQHSKHHSSNKTIQLDTQSLASVNVNIPDPVLPPTKSITVQTDEALDLNLADFEIPNRYVQSQKKVSALLFIYALNWPISNVQETI